MSATASENYRQLDPLRNEPMRGYEISFAQVPREEKRKTNPQFNYVCRFCKIGFKRKDRLDRHVFTHTRTVSGSIYATDLCHLTAPF